MSSWKDTRFLGVLEADEALCTLRRYTIFSVVSNVEHSLMVIDSSGAAVTLELGSTKGRGIGLTFSS